MVYVSVTVRQQVAERAKYHCEYCRSAELITSGPMHVEHIRPVAKEGETVLENLAYACVRCNLHKSTRTSYLDPVSDQVVPLFNPRTEKWFQHFAWSRDGTRIIGQTSIGRATILALHMNQASVVMSRSLWVSLNLHPPKDEA